MRLFKVGIRVIILSSLIPIYAQATVYLVSVGIADYPGSSMDLSLSANDARTVAWLYSKNSALQYCLLMNADATCSKVIAAMNRMFAGANAADRVVFFFSGHGYPGGFCLYDGNLSYDEIRAAMAGSRCRNKMIFADACFSGNLRTGRRSAVHSETAVRNANVMLFLSSRSDETSIERSGMQNGLFTTYLQKGLRGGADTNKDRIITARELFDYVREHVVALSHGRQHPVMWGEFSDRMPVMKW